MTHFSRRLCRLVSLPLRSLLGDTTCAHCASTSWLPVGVATSLGRQLPHQLSTQQLWGWAWPTLASFVAPTTSSCALDTTVTVKQTYRLLWAQPQLLRRATSIRALYALTLLSCVGETVSTISSTCLRDWVRRRPSPAALPFRALYGLMGPFVAGAQAQPSTSLRVHSARLTQVFSVSVR